MHRTHDERGDGMSTPGPYVTRGRRAPFSQVGDWVIIADPVVVAPEAKAIYWIFEGLTWRDHDEPENTQVPDPSRNMVAEMLGYSRPQSVDRYIDQLVAIGAVDKITNPGYANRYVVHQTPPDDYQDVQTIGQWKKRRADRIEAEKARREADKAQQHDGD